MVRRPAAGAPVVDRNVAYLASRFAAEEAREIAAAMADQDF
jgi:hypothetical protein